jgi:hypothetical protein
VILRNPTGFDTDSLDELIHHLLHIAAAVFAAGEPADFNNFDQANGSQRDRAEDIEGLLKRDAGIVSGCGAQDAEPDELDFIGEIDFGHLFHAGGACTADSGRIKAVFDGVAVADRRTAPFGLGRLVCHVFPPQGRTPPQEYYSTNVLYYKQQNQPGGRKIKGAQGWPADWGGGMMRFDDQAG